MAIVSDEQVIKVLRQYNPWWRNPLAIKEENKPQKRLAYYEALRMISHKTIRRFAVLSGARRVGKTTIMYQMMNSLIDEGVNPKNILYVSFDNPIVKLVNVETVLSIYESLYPIEGTRYIFLDEIQYTEHWELWMKVIYDSRKDIRLTATGSASPILEKGSTDSGTGRWSILKIPTMSFYEYCRLLQIEEPILPDNLRLTRLVKMSKAELGDLMDRFVPLEGHFNRYLMIGGFPELVLSDDDMYAQRMLREDVVDKVIKRDVLTLFNIRSPLLMEKLFLYLCMNSTEIFSVTTAAKELENTSAATIDSYIEALEMSNLIYLSKPMDVGSKLLIGDAAQLAKSTVGQLQQLGFIGFQLSAHVGQRLHQTGAGAGIVDAHQVDLVKCKVAHVTAPFPRSVSGRSSQIWCRLRTAFSASQGWRAFRRIFLCAPAAGRGAFPRLHAERPVPAPEEKWACRS